MKKLIICALISTALFASCKKDRKPTPTEPPTGTKKEYDVKLVVAPQTAQVQTNGTKATNAIATNATGFPKGISVIHFYAFNSDGKIVSGFAQDSTMSNFGTISLKLPADAYTVFIKAGTADMPIDRAFINNYDADIDVKINPAWSFFRNVFYKKLTIEVGPNSPAQQNVVLDRVVGQLTVKLLSKLPATAKKFILTVDKDRTSYLKTTGVIRKDTVDLTTADLNNTQFTRSVMIMNTTQPFTVSMVVLDAQGNTVADATVANVQVQANRQTVLTGNLNTSSNGDFSTSLNQAYDSTINVGF